MALAGMRLGRTRRSEPHVELTLITIAVALFFALALTRGIELPLLLLGGMVTLALAVARPQVGLYLSLAAIVLGDLRGANENEALLVQAFQPVFGTGMTPVELLLLATGVGVLVQMLFRASTPARGGDMVLPIAALLIAVGLGAGVGMSRGANLDILQQEIQGFFLIPLVYVIVVNTIRTRQDIDRLMWVFVALVTIMSMEIIHRYFTYVRGDYQLDAAHDLAFAHEDAIFCASALIILFGRVVWSGSVLREWRSVALLGIPLLALIVMKRRAGIIALDGALILLCLLLLRENFRLFLMTVPVAAVFAGLLIAVTWNEPGGKGQFARSFRTITGQETTVRDQSSDEYRRLELVNVRLNIENEPIVGLGFGREYTHYIQLADLSGFWTLYHYVPHNSIMWVWLKAGLAGFLALLALFAMALMRASQLVRGAPDGVLKIAGFSFGAIVLMFMLFSWADLGLISTRALVLFGLALGGIVAVSYASEDERLAAGATDGRA